jgi:cyclophilin family peptidyl-prolyl cis-trans isomerase
MLPALFSKRQQTVLYIPRCSKPAMALTILGIAIVCLKAIDIYGIELVFSFQSSVKRDAAEVEDEQAIVSSRKNETLVMKTSKGLIRIALRPDLSPESMDYINAMIGTNACEDCKFYSAVKGKAPQKKGKPTPSSFSEGSLHGRIANSRKKNVPLPKKKGPCPADLVRIRCPLDEAICDCHGPIMTKGMVAWSSGKTGPDFFINTFDKPARWWGTTHTVWGEVKDEASFEVLHDIFALPVMERKRIFQKKTQTFTFLRKPVEFIIELEDN